MLELNKVHLGDNMQLIKQIPNNTVDSIVTDPPYGISFMNKKWDYDVPSVEFWKEAYRVLKPGGHILVACGTRTQHRMAVNIEDAGFEIRDIVAWIYGSGFPKSKDISLAIDKGEGLPNRGHRIATASRHHPDGTLEPNGELLPPYEPKTDQAKQWQGFGTALKPSAEYFTLAKKPMHDKETSNEIMEVSKCLLKSFVRIVESTSSLNPKDSKGVSNIAQWIVKENTDTLEDLLEVMGMLQSYITENTNSNIVLLWLNTLVDLWKIKNTSTIKMELNTTTELKILKSMEWESILQNIILPKENQNVGQSAFVYDVASIFNVLKLKSMHIITHIAQENATSVQLDPKTNIELFTLARKPIEGTVANNVLKWGCGGLNIDGCRVDFVSEEDRNSTACGFVKDRCSNNPSHNWGMKDINVGEPSKSNGRFPANVIHDGSDEVVALFPKSGGCKPHQIISNNQKYDGWGTITRKNGEMVGYDDNGGSAARFFKTIKYSKEDVEWLNVNTAESNLSQEEKLLDIVANLVQIEAQKEGFYLILSNTIKPFMNEIRKQSRKDSVINMQQMKNTAEKSLLDLKHIITEMLNQNHVNYAEIQLLINTMTIIQNLMNIDGFVEVVTSNITLNNMVHGEVDCLNRLFYTAKASQSERNEGLYGFEDVSGGSYKFREDGSLDGTIPIRKNFHPTVKPLDLMQYLCRLITPRGGLVLEPFAGSGTTCIACKLERMNFIGMEIDADYVKIAEARIKAADVQYDIFDFL